MIEFILKELKNTWGYDTEELNDIREKLQDFGESCYWTGFEDGSSDNDYDVDFIFEVNGCGKKSDND
jgi:hypothetical protein